MQLFRYVSLRPKGTGWLSVVLLFGRRRVPGPMLYAPNAEMHCIYVQTHTRTLKTCALVDRRDEWADHCWLAARDSIAKDRILFDPRVHSLLTQYAPMRDWRRHHNGFVVWCIFGSFDITWKNAVDDAGVHYGGLNKGALAEINEDVEKCGLYIWCTWVIGSLCF